MNGLLVINLTAATRNDKKWWPKMLWIDIKIVPTIRYNHFHILYNIIKSAMFAFLSHCLLSAMNREGVVKKSKWKPFRTDKCLNYCYDACKTYKILHACKVFAAETRALVYYSIAIKRSSHRDAVSYAHLYTAIKSCIVHI